MNYAVIWTSRFKKDYKLLMKQGTDMSLLDDVIRLLSTGATLPEQYHDHALIGNFRTSGNVISSRTGCWFIHWVTILWFWHFHEPDLTAIYFRDSSDGKRKRHTGIFRECLWNYCTQRNIFETANRNIMVSRNLRIFYPLFANENFFQGGFLTQDDNIFQENWLLSLKISFDGSTL